MMRRIPVLLGMVTTTLVMLAHAAEPQPSKAKLGDKVDTASLQGEALLAQEKLAKSFKEFTARLLLLAQQMEASNKEEDREKAKILRDAIKLANEGGVDLRFGKVVDLLRNSKAASEARGFRLRTLHNAPVLDHRDPGQPGPGVPFLVEVFRRRVHDLGAEDTVPPALLDNPEGDRA